MLFVFSFAAVSAFITAALVLLATAGRLPFAAQTDAGQSSAASDRSIFRRQMAELASQRQLGLLDAKSAEEARLELARRILAAEKYLPAALSACDTKQENKFLEAGRAGRKTAAREPAGGARLQILSFRLFLSAMVLFVPLSSGAVYYVLGRPDMPEQPFRALMARDPAGLTPAENLARLEVLAARSPRDQKIADALAAAALQAGQFQEAANSYNQAIALGGGNAERLLGYALALTGFDDGIVGQQAEAAFRKVLELDPQNHQAQLFLARALVQNGQSAAATALLQGFWRQTPADSPWRQDLQAAIAALQAPQNNTDMSRRQHDFIAANIGRLEARLAAAPQNLQARIMLINAYLLLGQAEKAQGALAGGLKALPPQEAGRLAAFARQKGLAVHTSGQEK